MADKKTNQPLKTKQDPPKPFELNRNLILLVGGGIVLVIIIAFLGSFSRSDHQTKQQSDIKIGQSQQDWKVDESFSSYADAQAIRQKLGMDQEPKVVHDTDPELQRNLEQQKQQIQQLQQSLQQLQQSDQQAQQAPEPQQTLSPEDKQARQSSIFVPGGAPRSESKEDDSDQKDQKQDHKPLSDQTLAEQRESFMHGSGQTPKETQNQNTIQTPVSKNVLLAGTGIPAVLQSKIVSNLPGTIVARVSKDVYNTVNGKTLLVPRGSKLIGEYNSQTAYGDTRVQVKFTRLIRPNGSSIILPNQPGTDAQGVSGVGGQVDNHWGSVIGSAALSTVFSIPSIAAEVVSRQPVCTGDRCMPNYGGLVGSSMLQSVGSQIQQVGSKLTSRAMDVKPTITIDSGKQFSVMVTKDTYIPPYDQRGQ